MKKVEKKQVVRKLIDLSPEVVKELGRQAEEKHMMVKPYLELVLIEKSKHKIELPK